MSKEPKFFICEHCGNLMALLEDSGVPVVCCGDEMKELTVNTSDGAYEKHVPAVETEGGKITVTVGSVIHPMLPEHHIEWIALVSDDRIEIKYLQPGMQPTAEFEAAESGTAYAYCNLHSLWKTEF